MAMSRTLVVTLAICASGPAVAQEHDRLVTYRQLTSIEPRCATTTSDRELLVCGARRADRWRVPFIGYDAGDPRGESIEGERKRLASEPPRKCGNEAFLRNCGAVGVSVSTRLNGERLALRPLAP